jgi:hypothetical protein
MFTALFEESVPVLQAFQTWFHVRRGGYLLPPDASDLIAELASAYGEQDRLRFFRDNIKIFEAATVGSATFE